MRMRTVGPPRLQCDICPKRDHFVRRVVFRKKEMNLCVPCREAAEKIILEEAEAAAPMAVPTEALEETEAV